MGTSIDGLASGLNTTSIIDALMAVEALPQTQLRTKVASDQSMITALQQLNTRVTLLQSSAAALSKPGATSLVTATTNNPAVTATATAGAAAGSIDVTFSQLASTKTGVTEALSAWPTDGSGNPAHLTIVDKAGNATEITPASTSLDDVVMAINSAVGAGATAVKVPAGGGTYRLQITSTTAGAAGDFQAYQGTAADVTDGTAVDLFARPTAAVVRPAQDAQAILYKGTAAEQIITSATNTFTELLPGVSVTATAVTASPVTVSVAADNAGITKKAEDIIRSVNDVLGYIADSSAVIATTNATRGSTAKGGIFTGSSGIRGVSDAIVNAVVAPINGKSPSEYGIVITRNGDFTFDKEKFAASLAANPAATQAALSEISTRLAAATKTVSDSVSGTVPQLIKGRQSQVSSLNDQIANWDTRLETRRATLKAVYSNMESLLGGLKAQSSWLTSQIAGMSTSASGA